MQESPKVIKVECDKCNGTGYISRYASYANGICFVCSGTGQMSAYANSRKPSFEWSEFLSKKILFIVNMSIEDVARMSRQQCCAMDDFVLGMTMDRKCMWLYHFYRESIRPAVLCKINTV